MKDVIDSPTRMSDDLRIKVERMTPFQRKYCEFRAKGLKQSDAAQKAGSTAADRDTLGRVGYNTERLNGTKEYIMFLQEARAKASVVDDLEVIEKIRAIYTESLSAGNYNAANKAVELLGQSIGLFVKDKATATAKGQQQEATAKPKNNTSAFMEDADEEDVSNTERLSKVHSYMKDLGVYPKD